ncbi:MAG: IPT/TIG domain-containing protein [Spirochaetaceae bacterium]|jgi:transglutaminase-like putative cysteine protease|nr:IPT/TIG domain-containing protein [Spirochaetaceae bacterium]
MFKFDRGAKTAFPFVPALLLAAACGVETPRILMIDPRFAVTGQNLTIMGESFGDEQGESFVTIGGVRPTMSSFLEWSDNKIVLRIPDFGETGLIYVHRRNHRSNPVLISTLSSMPEFPKSQVSYAPVITQVRPASASIGELVVIQGSGFGSRRDGGAVLFSWAAERQPYTPAEVSTAQLIEARGPTGVYEAWSEHEIRVRVSDGATSGIVQVSVPPEKSNAVPFEVGAKPGVKTIKDKRTYSISYSVDVWAGNAVPPNSIYLWCSFPASTASQVNKETLPGSSKPFVGDYRGVSLYRLNDLKSGDNRQVSVSYLVDVYGVETRVLPELVKPYVDSPVLRTWTLPSSFVPSNDVAVKEMAAAFTGKERNPYLKAYSIYRGFLKEFTVTAGITGDSVRQAITKKTTDPYTAAMLYCALCRAAGIPAIPVSGVLCSGIGGAQPHYWVEFWIDEFGWIPVDPALGAGAFADPGADPGAPSVPSQPGESFRPRDNYERFYFGNMDNQHLAFSFGETILSQIDARGRTASGKPNYALQNIREEASGGIEAYSSHWSDINVIGVYSN